MKSAPYVFWEHIGFEIYLVTLRKLSGLYSLASITLKIILYTLSIAPMLLVVDFALVKRGKIILFDNVYGN